MYCNIQYIQIPSFVCKFWGSLFSSVTGVDDAIPIEYQRHFALDVRIWVTQKIHLRFYKTYIRIMHVEHFKLTVQWKVFIYVYAIL